MPARTTLDPSRTVREIAALHPHARPILAQYGLDTCCSGGQPLRLAAIASNVPLEILLDEIHAAVEKGGPIPEMPAHKAHAAEASGAPLISIGAARGGAAPLAEQPGASVTARAEK